MAAIEFDGQQLCGIRSFAERDADVWLAEELRANPDFAGWFCARTRFPGGPWFPADPGLGNVRKRGNIC
jgi:hypothetical protein